jgi:hypothetical protein
MKELQKTNWTRVLLQNDRAHASVTQPAGGRDAALRILSQELRAWLLASVAPRGPAPSVEPEMMATCKKQKTVVTI